MIFLRKLAFPSGPYMRISRIRMSCSAHVCQFMDNHHARETERIFAESTNTIDMVFRFLKHGIEAINSINPLFMTDMKKYHYRIWKETYIINSDKYLAQTYTILKKGINEGLFRKNIDIEIVAKLLNEQLTLMTDEGFSLLSNTQISCI
jgi:TetR/AcrR family transcriptional regulator, cholesterol catabolism regulator